MSGVVKASLAEMEYQASPFTASRPKIQGFREGDYAVSEEFTLKHIKVDDNVSLLAKPQTKVVVPARYLEEMEKLTRQALAVASHAEWVLGSAVVLLQQGETSSAVRSVESVGLAQSHNASLLARLLANLTHLRRDQYLSICSLSSSAKASLSQLPIPYAGLLFKGRIADTVSLDASTSSNQALVSIASSLKAKSGWKVPSNSSKKSASFQSRSPKGTDKPKHSFRGKQKEKPSQKFSFDKKAKK